MLDSRKAKLTIEPARREDLPSILELMKDAGLTHEGIEDATLFVTRAKDGTVIGSIGLEVWGHQGLLRSLVVAKVLRNQGLGSALVLYLLEQARARKLREVYLLSEEVGPYYLRFGFEFFDRKKVHGDVLRSAEFQGACLETAPVMRIAV